MLTKLYRKPYEPFFIAGLVTMCIALGYFLFSRNSYFDVSLKNYMVLRSFYVWFIFSAYIFLLSGLYFAISKMKFRVKKWLLVPHFIFVILFLLSFLVFSSFNTELVKNYFAETPFLVLFSFYGLIFLLDIFFFITSMLFLIINLFSFKKE